MFPIVQYMVRKIKVSSVYSEVEEPELSSACSPKGEEPEPTMEANEQPSDDQNAEQANEVNQHIEPITEVPVMPTEIR